MWIFHSPPLIVRVYHVFTRIHINRKRVFFLRLLWFFTLFQSECRIGRFRLFFRAKSFFQTGTSQTADNFSATQLCSLWLSNLTGHSPCTQTNLLDGYQLLLSVTMIVFILLQHLHRRSLPYVSLNLQYKGHRSSNQGPVGLQEKALPLNYIPLKFVARQNPLFAGIHIIGNKVFILDVDIGYLALLLRMPTAVASSFFYVDNCFNAGISLTAEKFCATELCPRCILCSTQHNVCSTLILIL